MPTYTPNYNLIKPLPGEQFNVSHANGNADIIDASLQKLKPLMFENISINSTMWTVSSVYEYSNKYPYRCAIPINGATVSMIPDVDFASKDAITGNLARDADTYDGGVYIYSKVKSNLVITRVTLWENYS